jgi:hypothetical protein
MHINTIRTPYDATALHSKLQLEIGSAKLENLDVAMSNEVQMHNVFAACASFNFKADLKKWWLPESRWNMLIRQYLHPDAVELWLDSIEAKLVKPRQRGIAVLRTNTVAQQGNKGGRYTWRRWGACILSISYRNNPAPQITMHSRSCYMGFLSILDMNVAHVLARAVAETVGNITPADMSFVWHIESMQMHAWKSLPLFFSSPSHWPLEDIIEKPYRPSDSIAVRNAKKVLADYRRRDSEGERYGEMKYAQTAYPRRRLHTEHFGYDFAQQFEGGEGGVNQRKACKPLPSLRTSQLSLEPLYRGRPEDAELASNLVELVME